MEKSINKQTIKQEMYQQINKNYSTSNVTMRPISENLKNYVTFNGTPREEYNNTPVIIRYFNFKNEKGSEEIASFRCRLYQKEDYCISYGSRLTEDDFYVWIAGKDVAKFLKFVDTNDAVHQFVDEKYRKKYKDFSTGGNQQMKINGETIFINSAGIDMLIKNCSFKLRNEFIKDVIQKIYETRKYNPHFDDD